ncbi:MAG: hypothetical protein PHP59_03075 [Methanofollis sp.]|uniref:hypothetical protein n=1 Tax=Methanofollis sp. TaxID=2052835 RepID=UPI002630783A|nr:hypothetical protein [Methanofollis sp.]MDD4254337.1 hypothetical protein [Methanofollis sp.]
MKGRTAITVLILAMAALIGTVVAANETPVVPQEFSGTVTINGNPAPAGTVIEAFIDGTSYGKLATESTGVYGGVEIDDDRLVVKGGGDVIGKTITFTVNGNKAAKTAVFSPGELGNIDLSVQAGGGTTPGGSTGSGSSGSGGRDPSSPREVFPDVRTPASPDVGTTPLTTTSTGTVDRDAAVVSSDRIATLSVPEGTTARTSEGTPLTSISIRPASPAEVPAATGETGFVAAGYTYICEPASATFNPAITLTFAIPPEVWAKEDISTLTVKWYNPKTGAWEDLETTVDREKKTVSARVSHFSTFALFVEARAPASGDVTPTTTATPAPDGEETPAIPWTIMGIVIIGAGIVVGGYLWKKKQN